MPAQNYVLLERIELNASAASVTFSNIPQSGYTDLKIVMSIRGDNTNNYGSVLFNNSSTGYTRKILYGNGSSAFSTGPTGYESLTINPSDATASTFANYEMYIPNYTSSNSKSFSVDAVTENNGTTATAMFHAGLWANSSAISSIVIQPTGNFVANSTFSLYGLAAVGTTPVIAPKAVGGNITTDGTYWYHTFFASDTFVPNTTFNVDYLVVAGGGGGGQNCGGGGGAGGLRSTVTATGGGGSLESALSVTSGTSYTVTVGAGGAASANDTSQSANGSNSVFGSITSIGGGGTKPSNTSAQEGKDGGSGGGSNGSGNGSQGSNSNGGLGTANQGFNGGKGWQNGPGAYNQRGGGGGGAGAVGVTATNSVTPDGGAGVTVAISGSSVTYAGGGGGGGFNYTAGAGGAGGGGAAGVGNNGNASSGTAYTGGGGGGAMYGASGNGGSGIVIVRYPIA